MTLAAAIGFTLWAMGYQCPTTGMLILLSTVARRHVDITTALDDGVCSLMNIYVLLASWVNPILGKRAASPY